MEAPIDSLRRGFTADLNGLIRKRVFDASPVQLLSDRGNKIVEVVEDQSGHRFVRRNYPQRFVNKIELTSNLTFEESWKAMQELFASAGIEIVSSFLLTPDIVTEKTSRAIVSEFLEDPRPLLYSPLEAKKNLAKNLGSLLTVSDELVPHPQVFMWDMFQLKRGQNGDVSILLTDVDPFVLPKRFHDKDMPYASCINRIADLLWDDWCHEDEREAVMREFIQAVSPVLDEFGENEGRMTLYAFTNAHLMSQGFDRRRF